MAVEVKWHNILWEFQLIEVVAFAKLQYHRFYAYTL